MKLNDLVDAIIVKYEKQSLEEERLSLNIVIRTMAFIIWADRENGLSNVVRSLSHL